MWIRSPLLTAFAIWQSPIRRIKRGGEVVCLTPDLAITHGYRCDDVPSVSTGIANRFSTGIANRSDHREFGS